MPSYRVTLSIGELNPGIAPDELLPAVAAAAAERAVVEASEVRVVSYTAQLVIRFTAEDADRAIEVATHTAARARTLAEVPRSIITRREKGRWLPL
ncbi:hypothetical protein [Mycetocola spongiae]|uniref:hypothetical protein n=1 Tax=Mycetocola spongiae TaxID=2859226 RepID=UPI001CF204AF|nr:hypothetical protein [Mycetocola spongiae]UCR88280.1 hypothetical protein KXZ72_09855 [Mycetocola spongiae]